MVEPVFSIIIPAYNADKYIIECLESIKDQTFQDYEVLIIDDGSDDNTSLLVRRYITSDSRFKYFRQENRGPSIARNLGIDNALGSYILFVDADDMIEKDTLAVLSEKRECADVLFFGIKFLSKYGSRVVVMQDSVMDDSVKCDNSLTDLLLGKDMLFGYTWNKLYKKSIIDKWSLRFEGELRYKEDEAFTLGYVNKCKSIAFIRNVLYKYRVLENSLSHGKNLNRQGYELNRVLSQLLLDCPYTNLKRAFVQRIWDQYVYELIYSPSFFPKDVSLKAYNVIKKLSIELNTPIKGIMAKTIRIPGIFLAVWLQSTYYWVFNKKYSKENVLQR